MLLRSKLAEHLIDAEENVRFYSLCAQCLNASKLIMRHMFQSEQARP